MNLPGLTSLPSDVPELSNQALTFLLGTQAYGVDILQVREIRGWAPVTRIPQSPSHMLGVLNLRGSIVPIIDMRLRFCLEQAQFTPQTVIVVLSLGPESNRRECGLVVDGVSDVVDLAAADLKDPPTLGTQVRAEFIKGLATVADRMLIVLDVDKLIRRDLEHVESPALAGAA